MLEKLRNWLFGEKKKTEKNEGKKAFSETRKVSDQGGSYYVNLPKKWFNKNDIDPDEVEEVRLLANSDILIVNPNRENEVREKIEEKTYEVYQEEKKTT